jgi:hypothetical protein
MTHPREAALAWIRLALTEEMPQAHPDKISTNADVLHAIAIDYDVPVEELVRWIHGAETTDYSAAAWMKHCTWYAQFRQQNCSVEVLLPPHYPE